MKFPACRFFGHRYWWYSGENGLDFVYGCIHCKNPELEKDRVKVTAIEGSELCQVDSLGMQRLIGSIRTAAHR